MSTKIGVNSKLYIRSGGNYAAPTWTEINLINDFSVAAPWDAADANTRASRVKGAVKTMLGLEFSGTVKKTPGDVGYELLYEAHLSDEVLDVLVLDGPEDEPGSSGWRVDCQCFDFGEDQALGNALYNSFVLRPTPTANPPKAALVAGTGTLTYASPGGDAEFA